MPWHVLIAALLTALPLSAAAKPMTIRGEGPPPEHQVFGGNAWRLFLEGEIEADSGDRLESFIRQNNIPEHSWVYFNSPGGNLAGGISLGRVIRAHGLLSNIGTLPRPKDRSQGECYSACALAFLGGKFRFVTPGSKYGVHRFSFTRDGIDKEGLAQAVSALIVSYLREMDVDSKLFNLASVTAPSEMRVLQAAELEQLNVVNNGTTRAKWTIESTTRPDGMYLKGERETVHGINKFLVVCPANEPAFLHIIFDPQGREDEVLQMNVETLWIDEAAIRVETMRINKTVHNGWINVVYPLSVGIREALLKARESVGLGLRWRADSGLFLGFEKMPFRDGASKLPGFLRVCGQRN